VSSSLIASCRMTKWACCSCWLEEETPDEEVVQRRYTKLLRRGLWSTSRSQNSIVSNMLTGMRIDNASRWWMEKSNAQTPCMSAHRPHHKTTGSLVRTPGHSAIIPKLIQYMLLWLFRSKQQAVVWELPSMWGRVNC
jgi:hypothetical protein